jgi:cation diffusion facilitator CzcD-associated flavoprotein CzcO
MRTNPQQAKETLLKMTRAQIGDDMVDKHFTPSYNPWDQRMCLIPNGDLFKCINNGTAKVITGHIDHWTEKGIKLKSGEHLEADIIVTATGLKMVVMSGIEFKVDNHAINFPDTFTYKGMMYSGLPNMAQTFGYINASWTLRADLTSEYVCRLLNHMDATGQNVVTPTLRQEDENMEARDWIEDFSSGYMQRMMHLLPKQGHDPWRNTQNYKLDKVMIRRAPIADDVLVFSEGLEQQAELAIEEANRAVA